MRKKKSMQRNWKIVEEIWRLKDACANVDRGAFMTPQVKSKLEASNKESFVVFSHSER